MTGLFTRGHTLYDYAPAAAARDAARKLAPVAHLIAAAGEDPVAYAGEYAAAECAAQLAAPPWAKALPAPDQPPSVVVHRAVADRARLLAIDLLAAAFKPAAEREEPVTPGLDEPARSRLFDRLDVDHVRGIDATARTVGGTEDPE